MNSPVQEIIQFIRKLYNEPTAPIPLHAPVFKGNEKKYLLDCIDSTFISITTSGGGVLLFQDEALAKKAKHLTTQAKVAHPWEFEHDEIGYNYRMPSINAALGLAQLEQLPKYLELKREIAIAYEKFFSTLV